MDGKLKVLLIIDNLGTGGAQRQILNLAVGLSSQKIETHLFTYQSINVFENILINNGIKHYNYIKKNRLSISPILKIINLHNKNKYSVICVFLFTPSFYTLLASLFFKVKTRIVISERTFENGISFFHRHITRSLYFKSQAIVVNSNHQLIVLQKKIPTQSHKILFIPNGVDMSRFKPVERINNNGLLNILAIGRVSMNKNTYSLIEACDHLVNWLKYRDIKFFWVGSEEEIANVKNEYAVLCRNTIIARGLANYWEWISPTIEIEKYYNTCNILVHPSLGEGFPNVICESMACGLPVIASNVYDHSIIVKEEENGFLFDPKNVGQLIDCIIKYYNLNAENKSKMSALALQTAVEDFSLEINIIKYLKLFENLMLYSRIEERVD